MKSSERRKYSASFIRTQRAFERKYVPLVFAALRSQIDAFVSAMRQRGTESALSVIDKVLLNEGVAEVLQDLYIDAGLYYGNRTFREIDRSTKTVKKEKANFGYNEIWSQDIIDYLKRNLLHRAVLPITETTRQQILQVLERAQREQWSAGFDRIASELESEDLLLWRALRIVRTELAHAAAIGQQSAKDSSPYETVDEWIAANDHRTRHGHRRMDGETVISGQKFQVPMFKGKIEIGTEMMSGPGDPTASGGNTINCRCSKAVVARRDERGQLIFKSVRQTA